jgi:hypothetical protein
MNAADYVPHFWHRVSEYVTHYALCRDCEWTEDVLGKNGSGPEDHVKETGHTVEVEYLHRVVIAEMK